MYSSVGHAGASGYTTVMILAGLAPETIRPTALVLNILVASIASYRFWRAGLFSWQLFWPFAVLSVPLAFVGGMVKVPVHVFKVLVGLALFAAAVRMLITLRDAGESRPAPLPAAMLSGAAIGLTSGLTGVGGGIYLSPLLVLCRWANLRTAGGISAVFILVNSLAGFAGQAVSFAKLPASLPYWACAAVGGGLLGSHLGVKRLATPGLRIALALVLIIAASKLALS